MFKKSSLNKQLDLFSTQSSLMCQRESKQYDDELAWQNKFYQNVKINEEIFRPLYTNKVSGAPT